MPHSISLDEEKNIIQVTVSGEVDHDEHCIVREDVIEAVHKSKPVGVIVDLRELIVAQDKMIDCYAFGESIAKKLRGFRIAHVAPSDMRTRQFVKFTSIVESNRGVITAEFETIGEAQEWLLN
jgi:hypothetical protein